jgi:16S rRNA U516 pseudouridylate synthase RsuA-like enzyme
VERNRKAGQNPPRVVAPIEEEEEVEGEDDKEEVEKEVNSMWMLYKSRGCTFSNFDFRKEKTFS